MFSVAGYRRPAAFKLLMSAFKGRGLPAVSVFKLGTRLSVDLLLEALSRASSAYAMFEGVGLHEAHMTFVEAYTRIDESVSAADLGDLRGSTLEVFDMVTALVGAKTAPDPQGYEQLLRTASRMPLASRLALLGVLRGSLRLALEAVLADAPVSYRREFSESVLAAAGL